MADKYDRKEVISRLMRHGFNPKPNKDHITYWEVEIRKEIGIKLWGLLDFIGVPVRRVKRVTKRKKRKHAK